MRRLPTWGGRSEFKYTGSVETGTHIRYGRKGWRQFVSRNQYGALLERFAGQTVPIGTSRDSAPADSVGAWLQKHVTKTAIASYVGSILLHEGYAERGSEASEIRFR